VPKRLEVGGKKKKFKRCVLTFKRMKRGELGSACSPKVVREVSAVIARSRQGLSLVGLTECGEEDSTPTGEEVVVVEGGGRAARHTEAIMGERASTHPTHSSILLDNNPRVFLSL
jgi:hypothetical protein